MGAHLGDVLGDRRRGLSHWVTKLKNQGTGGRKIRTYPRQTHQLVWFGLVPSVNWREQREETYGFGAEILGGWFFRGRTGGSRRSWGLENFGRSRWRTLAGWWLYAGEAAGAEEQLGAPGPR